MAIPIHAKEISVAVHDRNTSEIRMKQDSNKSLSLIQNKRYVQNLNGTSAVFAEATVPEVLTDIPSGTMVNYIRNSDVYMNVLGVVEMDYDSGHSANIVSCDNGDVYIDTPFAAADMVGYLKGTKDSEDNIIVKLPQSVAEEYDNERTIYTIYAMKYDSNLMTYIPDDNQEICYSYDKQTGTYALMKSEKEITYTSPAEKIVGFVGENGNWVGYGEFNQEWTPFDDSAVVVPENLNETDWIFSYWRTKNYDISETKSLIKGYYDGNGNYYFKGMYKSIPEAVVVAHEEGDSIEFNSKQYLGISNGYHTFFMGGKHWREYDSYWDYWDDLYELMPSVKLGIDKEKKTIYDSYDVSPKEAAKNTPKCFIINGGTERLFEMQICRLPEFKYQPSDISLTPQNPIIVYFLGFDDTDNEYCVVDFDLPMENKEGYLLNESQMYYNFISHEGRIIPVTAADLGGEDFSNLTDALTNIPYNLDAETGIYNDGVFHSIYLYDKKFESCGIQSCHVVGDKTYKSDVVYISDNSGIEDIVTEKMVTSIRYYNLYGIEVYNPSCGIFIKVETFADGKIVRKKILL